MGVGESVGDGGVSTFSCCCRELSTETRLRRAFALAWSGWSDIVKTVVLICTCSLRLHVVPLVLCCYYWPAKEREKKIVSMNNNKTPVLFFYFCSISKNSRYQYVHSLCYSIVLSNTFISSTPTCTCTCTCKLKC